MSRTARTAALALAVLGLVPAAANAAEVRVNSTADRVMITGDTGEASNLRVTHATGGVEALVDRIIVEELGNQFETRLRAGSGCLELETNKISCSVMGAGTWRLHATLGDGNDRLVSHLGSYGIVADVDAYLGAGADYFEATAAETGSEDYVSAGTGTDVIYSGRQDDHVVAGDGNDLIFAGNDEDIAMGDLGDDKIDGGLGADQLHGSAGNDMLGQLRLEYRCTSTGTLGSPTNCRQEYVFASDPVADGQDYLSGGDDNDRLSLFDNHIDSTPSCGYGTDTLERDPYDPNAGTQQYNACETVTVRN